MSKNWQDDDKAIDAWIKSAVPDVEISNERLDQLLARSLSQTQGVKPRMSWKDRMAQLLDAYVQAPGPVLSLRFAVPALAGLAIGILIGGWLNEAGQASLMAYLLSPTLGLEGL